MFRLSLTMVFCACAAVSVAAAPANLADHAGMARMPAGMFLPPFRDDSARVESVQVKTFWIDRRAVTTGEYLNFVRKNPQHARSRIPRLLADNGYLRTWEADLQPGARLLPSPVTAVSWYAAKAYCADQGKHLPTTAEWELAATALPPGTDSATQERGILEWYSRPVGKDDLPVSGSGTHHASGVRDMHGVIWEWTADFNAWSGGGVNARGVKGGGLSCGGAAARAVPNTSYATYMRWAFRGSLRPDYTVGTLGFRCARNGTRNGE